MIFIVVEPFFINEIVPFHKFFCFFIIIKYTLTSIKTPFTFRKSESGQSTKSQAYYTKNDQILMSTQLQYKKMNGKMMM
jgi:hypothetical protein